MTKNASSEPSNSLEPRAVRSRNGQDLSSLKTVTVETTYVCTKQVAKSLPGPIEREAILPATQFLVLPLVKTGTTQRREVAGNQQRKRLF